MCFHVTYNRTVRSGLTSHYSLLATSVSQLNHAFYALMEKYGFCPLWIGFVPHTMKKEEQCLECDDDSSAQSV